MNKRFCKLGQYAAKAFFLFAVCGATYSCKDDYDWDDGDPTWLGSSIYEYLEGKGNYTNFVRLINDLDYREVLARTGSKTLFVADDDAFNTFYQNNSWGVHSYEQLTRNQKKLLLNSAMVNNAYLLEMMSSTKAGSGDNATPVQGECLRRETASDVTDSIPHLYGEDLPVTYNPTDRDYWARFRDKGIYLAMDSTTTMMTHFLATQLAKHTITDADFAIITGKTRTATDAYIYDSKVLEQDITCQNGYVNRLDKVLINPSNMAEVIRTNSNTKIFSHMLDRFSAPFYSASLTNRYQLLGNNVDSVFQKRYFSERSIGGSRLNSTHGIDPAAERSGAAPATTVSELLAFDPGWNAYFNEGIAVERDMAAIFCPTDEKFMDYFFSDGGGGHFLMNAYAPTLVGQITPQTTDLNKVYEALDQIPIDVLSALLNNLMKNSFNNTVPSKFETIKNDAADPMFDENYDYHRQKVVGSLLANNGVIYLMDEVTSPAKYAAVSAPALVERDKRIFNWAIQQRQLAGVYVDYYAYLLAMSSRFSFFVPADDNFIYVDPLSFMNPDNTSKPGKLIGRAYKYAWPTTGTDYTVESYLCEYDLNDHTYTFDTNDASTKKNENVKTASQNRLKDMLETHTIIHDDNHESTGFNEFETGAECNKHFFLAKNNAVVRIDNASKRKSGMTVQGGMQYENGFMRNVIGFDDKSAQTNGYGNGFAYTIDGPLQPTIESVYSVMYNNPNFHDFLELCKVDADVIKYLWTNTTEQPKYYIFNSNHGLPCFDKATGNLVESATNVRFFNNYRYTIYVPTNSAVQDAINNRDLPTWQSIRTFLTLDDNGSPTNDNLSVDDLTKAKAMVLTLLNFIKYHFQDNCTFADDYTLAPTSNETATMKTVGTGEEATKVYCKVHVAGGAGSLTVTDDTGNQVSITSDKNIVARDYITSGKTSSTPGDAKDLTITTSSSVVLHGVNGVLDYKTYTGNKYSSEWTTAAAARRYVARYPIIK